MFNKKGRTKRPFKHKIYGGNPFFTIVDDLIYDKEYAANRRKRVKYTPMLLSMCDTTSLCSRKKNAEN